MYMYSVSDLCQHELHFLLGVLLAETATRSEAERRGGEVVFDACAQRRVTQPALRQEGFRFVEKLGATRRDTVMVEHASL